MTGPANQIFFWLFIAGTFSFSAAQDTVIRGRIADSHTREPLAFVNIVFDEHGHGTVSNIDGEFSIPAGEDISVLEFSCLGYRPCRVDLKKTGKGPLSIWMEKTSYNIDEVRVSPGPNPAHRIIKRVTGNLERNDPENLASFRYTSYNRMHFTLEPDTAKGGNNEKSDLQEFIEEQHLFLMEFVSEKYYRKPDRHYEKVTASRVSGFQNPSFTLLATQMQSFSFYDDFIRIMDNKYLNPVTGGSTSRYFFRLRDTLYTRRGDTVFVIYYRPYKNRNFTGLTGVLHINTNGYAIQNVRASSCEKSGMFDAEIWQEYDLADGKHWFPVKLNTNIRLSGDVTVSDGKQNAFVKATGRSYLQDIEITPGIEDIRFSNLALTVERNAHRKDDSYWNKYRVHPLTPRDTVTYHRMDSIGKKEHLDEKLAAMEVLFTGQIPVHFLNIDYTRLIGYNKYEGLRPGISLSTNERLSQRFSLGVMGGYGLRDKAWKYGGHLSVFPFRETGLDIRLGYRHDVMETGSYAFLDKPGIQSTEFLRSFLIEQMNMTDEYRASIGFPFLDHFRIRTFLRVSQKQSFGNYAFDRDPSGSARPENLFRFAETGFKLRFAFGEKFISTPGGNKVSLGTDHPVIHFNYIRGMEILEGEYPYNKAEIRVSASVKRKYTGETGVVVAGGMVDRDIPRPNLYNGHATYGRFHFDTENSFATMRQGEFLSHRFVSLFFRQNFGYLLFRKNNFRPEIVLATNIGFGQLGDRSSHMNTGLKSMEKGYFESGILINNILRQWLAGYGLGVYYRYGPYRFEQTIDNFACVFTLNFNL